ncbi:hypothetical protein OBBRIDRAFT_851188, partial [Obba rivulosa]
MIHISAQLSNLHIANNSIASSLPPYLPPTTPPNIPAWTVWVNTLWFCSLILSLSAASIGLFVRQWLASYTGRSSSDSQESAFIHYMRYDEGFVPWRVPEIMAMLPILLQLALVLFLVGLVVFLRTLNTIVAGFATSLVAALLLFSSFTTIAPTFWPQCPYKSPQALAFFR